MAEPEKEEDPLDSSSRSRGTQPEQPPEQKWPDTGNKFCVGARDHGIQIAGRLPGWMSAYDAVNLAAWIVALADPDRKEFERVFKAIIET